MGVLKSNRHNRFLLQFVSILIALCLGACGAPGVGGDSSGETVAIVGASGDLACAAENDCDGDGIYTVCDVDDADIDAMDVSAACDEDGDGFVDSPCTTFADVDGDGAFGDAERMEYGPNCDTCPDMYDPDQADADWDGVGDLCVAVLEELAPDINLNAMPPDEDATGEDPEGADEGGEAVSEDEAVDPNDPDGDGLSLTIDPDPEKSNSWGYVDADDYDEAGCVPEKAFNDYDYVKGFTGIFRMAKTSGALQPGELAASGVRNVSGVVGASPVALPTYACVGASATQSFDYGIYIVSFAGLIHTEAGALKDPMTGGIRVVTPN